MAKRTGGEQAERARPAGREGKTKASRQRGLGKQADLESAKI
jgi:hypothetical protein